MQTTLAKAQDFAMVVVKTRQMWSQVTDASPSSATGRRKDTTGYRMR